MKLYRKKKYLSFILAIVIIFSNTIALASNETKQEGNKEIGHGNILLNYEELTLKNGTAITSQNSVIPNEDIVNFVLDVNSNPGQVEINLFKKDNIREDLFLKAEYRDIKVYEIADNGEEKELTDFISGSDLEKYTIKINSKGALRIKGNFEMTYIAITDNGIVAQSGNYYDIEDKDNFVFKVETNNISETFNIPVRGKNTDYNPEKPVEPEEAERPEIEDDEPWDEGLFRTQFDGNGVRIDKINLDHPKIEEYRQRKTLVIPEKIGGKDVVNIGFGNDYSKNEIFANKGFTFNQIIWPETMTKIGNIAFKNYENELYISFPKNLKTIGNNSFSGIKNLKGNLDFPESLTTIGDYVFSGCENLESELMFPESLVSIGNGAFQNCYKLYGDLIFPDSLKTIGQSTFKNCTGFDGVLKFNDGLEEIGLNAFEFENKQGQEPRPGHFSSNINIPISLKKFGSNAFYPGTNHNEKYNLERSLVFYHNKEELGELNFSKQHNTGISITSYESNKEHLSNIFNYNSHAWDGRFRNFIEISEPNYTQHKFNQNPIITDKDEVKTGENLRTTIPICINEPSYDRRMEGTIVIYLVDNNLKYKLEESQITFKDKDSAESLNIGFEIIDDKLQVFIKQNTPLHFDIIINGKMEKIDSKLPKQDIFNIKASVEEVKNVVEDIDDKYVFTKSKAVKVIEVAKYTVTYTDGVEDKVVFDDYIVEDVVEGSEIPTFWDGRIPSGKDFLGNNVIFKGWKAKGEEEVYFPTVAKGVKATKNVVYEAQWEQRYEIKFIANGGKVDLTLQKKDPSIVEEYRNYYLATYPELGETPPDKEKVTYGTVNTLLGFPMDYKIVEPNTPTRVNSIFAGWYTSEDFTEGTQWNFATDTIKGDTTLYAKWIPDKYTVTFNSNGGTDVPKQIVKYEEKVTKPTQPQKEGYKFEGWFKNIGLTEEYDFESLVTEDITLYAKWIPVYTVIYNANEADSGTVPVDGNEYEKNAEVTTLGNTGNLVKDGYTFKGWNTKADGSGVSYNPGDKFKIIENTSLYAQWEKNEEPTKPTDPSEPTKPTKPERPTPTIKEITLIGGQSTLTKNIENQLNRFKVNRIYGKDRYATSVAVAKEYSKSNIVLLASGEKYTDELTATVLANKLGAPIMLTRKDAIPAEVKAEINRLGATKVILIGGNASISEKVEKELANYTVERIGGPDRYDTAILVGNQVRALTASKTEAILVDGTDFPDAIAMTSMGVEENMPILLTKPGQLPTSTAKTIEDWKLTEVTIGGGSKSVSGEVEKEVRKYAEVNRIAGADRYETSVLVAEQVYVKPKHAVIASGEVFPDAIVGASYAAKKGYPIVLSRGNNVPDVVMDYVLGNR